MASARCIVVTGGASGIGEATAMRFAEAGDVIVLGDINVEAAGQVAADIRAAGGRAETFRLDVGDESSIRQFFTTVSGTHGAIDVLVNSAGLLQNAVTTAATDMETHDRIWQVNYRGTFLCCRFAGTMMAEHGSGSIVNLASINSFRPLPLPAYTPGKAAIKSLTELLAVELGASGVRVNGVAPGYTLTQALQARIDSGHRDPQAMNAATALGRMVMPSDVADAIYFLSSPQAAAITGVTLPVDAGWLPAVSYKSYPATPEGAD